jgi:hypothetical protein
MRVAFPGIPSAQLLINAVTVHVDFKFPITPTNRALTEALNFFCAESINFQSLRKDGIR